MQQSVEASSERLTLPERRSALRELKKQRRSRRVGDRRATSRQDCKDVTAVVELRMQRGDVKIIHAEPHNISETGMVFLHCFNVPVKTPCQMKLCHADGRSVELQGTVSRCCHVWSRATEVGIAFAKPVDPAKLFG